MSKKIEFVYTPRHGSWLNMVEIELSVLVRQCLKRRFYQTCRLLLSGRQERGARSETAWAQASTGASPLKMPASGCANSIHQLTLDGGLGRWVNTRLVIRRESLLSPGPIAY
jgi:hypothetical protein